jgi:hypothetical protein
MIPQAVRFGDKILRQLFGARFPDKPRRMSGKTGLHFRQYRKAGLDASGHPVTENTTNIDIFAAIVPFQRIPSTASDLIDENGSLPYKPRQLSAMARSDRGGSFGPETVHVWGQHLTDLSHYQANFARSAENDP